MTNTDRQIESRLAEQQIRYTPGRAALVKALTRADGPMSAAELHQTLGPAIPLSSLYRSLAVLEEAGILTPHFGQRSVTRYELAEWIAGHHHHLVCIECGVVEDVSLSAAMESRVDILVDTIASSAGFQPANHNLEIEGTCGKCH